MADNQIKVYTITPDMPEFQEVWNLREEVLRKPLGLSLKNDNLSRDFIDTIFVASSDGSVIGCVFMHRLSDEQIQLRAMAVYPTWQGKGVGRMLVQAAEKYAWHAGYKQIILHARKVAMGFYASMGYTPYGDEFTEVGIPHYMMSLQAPEV